MSEQTLEKEVRTGRQWPKIFSFMSIRSWITAIVAVVFLAWAYFGASEVTLYYVDIALLAILSALALNFLMGNAGLVSVGTGTFQGVGAYMIVMTGFMLPDAPAWLTLPIALVLGALAAGVVGFLIGIPSLRLAGLYLLFATLALVEIGLYVFQEIDAQSNKLSGHRVAAPEVFGIKIISEQQWFIALLVLAAIAVWFIYNISSGDPGRILAAVKANQNAAAAMGIGVVSAKMRTFLTMSMLTGFAGAVSAYFVRSVGGEFYTFNLAVTFIAMGLVGGLGTVRGSVIGAFVISFLPYVVSMGLRSGMFGPATDYVSLHQAELQTILYGGLIVLFIFFFPGGVESLINRRWGKKQRKEQRKELADLVIGQGVLPKKEVVTDEQ